MNTLAAKLDTSDYGYEDYLNYNIDGYWLDKILEETYPGNFFVGTIPTLSGMVVKEEEKMVWQRILPGKGKTTICPILMCPDDLDFSCTLIVAQIENTEDSIKWSKIGLDKTTNFSPQNVGTVVEWLEAVGPFEFSKTDYFTMLDSFKP